MIYKNLPCIIKNSKDIIYKFCLDSSDNLIVENYTEFNIKNNIKFIYKHSILDYSVDIDDTDRVYIAFITKDGILKYSILDSPDIEQTISSVPSKDYKIDYLTIKNISSDIHIFYMIQNKYNIDNWTINHSFFHNNLWNSNKLGETLFINNSLPYSIDFYKNNIYIFYLTNNSNQYCIQKFSIPFSMWSTIEANILLLNSQNAELLINNKGIGVICYNSYINKSINTLLKFKDFNVNSSIWSDDLLVKNNTFDSSLPSVLCRNDSLFLFCRENNTLFLVKSFYETTNLGEKKIMPYKDIVSSCKYITNKNLNNSNKSNFLFFIDATPPYTILEDSIVKDFLKVDSIKTDQKFNPLNGPLKETFKIIAKNSNLNNKPLYNDEESPIIEYTNNTNLNSNLDDFATMHYPLGNNFKNKPDEKNENLRESNLDSLTSQPKKLMGLNSPVIDHFKNSLSLKESEVEQLKNSLILNENEIDQLRNSFILKQNEIEQFKNSLNLKETELEHLRTSLTLKQNETEQFKNSLNLKEVEIDQFRTSLNSKEIEIEQLKNSLSSKELQLQSLNDSYSSTKNLVDEKDLLIQNLYCKIKDLELQTENLKNLQMQKKKSFIDLFKKDH